ncbi:MAG: NAD(P)/FAD-dependent oxidoreductase [Actinobacteria bacterium]|nr:NAD(P)/FAD-dependent oxidoreductase [Actinomycetota bacterium]
MKTELAVIGAGPAGLSAAVEAAKNGVDVTVIDENKKPGGQLFKQIHRFFGSEEHLAGTRGFEIGNMLLDDAKKYGVKVLLDNVVWGLFSDLKLGISDNEKVSIVEADKIVIATGAIENSLSFPGWTLPNIMGAGAVQTMINVNRVLPGNRVLTIGSGNVGLIVSYQLIQAGANVAAVIEAMDHVSGYMVHASKIARMGVKILTSHTITRAMGDKFVENVEIAKIDKNFDVIAGSEEIFNVDLVCIAVGLRPLNELCWMTGIKFEYLPELGGFIPIHDDNMQSNINGIYVAGDVTGIEEASTAMEEGKLAGIAVSLALRKIEKKKGLSMVTEARRRLRMLRQGPFGNLRQEAKEKVIKKYYT